MTASTYEYRPPSDLLKELGITEPQEIGIEAIAQYCGATIIYEPLEGCEARILGYADRAIITVNSGVRRSRQRFSAAHELGHWMRDRGKVAFACTEEVLNSEWTEDNPERRANQYAADLLLPEFMFGPRTKNKEITFVTVADLARQFQTSMTATAIRLVQQGSFPAMLIFIEEGKRKFIRGPDLPEALWPREQPHQDTLTHDLICGKHGITGPVESYADSWIDHPDARRYQLVEDAIKVSASQILTLLWWKDERQLLDFLEEE